ncbi:hypothetical protein D3C74_473180 [compost metagenome]
MNENEWPWQRGDPLRDFDETLAFALDQCTGKGGILGPILAPGDPRRDVCRQIAE